MRPVILTAVCMLASSAAEARMAHVTVVPDTTLSQTGVQVLVASEPQHYVFEVKAPLHEGDTPGALDPTLDPSHCAGTSIELDQELVGTKALYRFVIPAYCVEGRRLYLTRSCISQDQWDAIVARGDIAPLGGGTCFEIPLEVWATHAQEKARD